MKRGKKSIRIDPNLKARHEQIDHQEGQEHGRLDPKADEIAEHRGDRHTQAGEVNLPHGSAACDKGVGGTVQTAGKIVPGDIAAHVKQESRHSAAVRQSCHIAENKGKHNRREQRLDHGPGRAQDRLFILGDEVPFDKQQDQIPILPDFPEIEAENLCF